MTRIALVPRANLLAFPIRSEALTHEPPSLSCKRDPWMGLLPVFLRKCGRLCIVFPGAFSQL